MGVKRILPFFVTVLLLLAIIPTAIAFAIADPSSMTIDDIFVNRHLIHTNDMLIYAKYTVSYGTNPADDISDTFIFKLLDTDNSTQLGTVLAYPYNSEGYGRGLISFYFDNVTAPTWGSSYKIQIIGNPSQFITSPKESFPIASGDYSSLTTPTGNSDELRSNLIDISEDLEVAWTTTLLTQEDTGIVLSSNGESYFRNAILGLQTMVPDLFLFHVEDPDYSERTYTTTQESAYESRFDGTWVGRAVTESSDMFGGIDKHIISGAVMGLFIILAIGACAVIFKTPNPGFPQGAAIVLMGTLLGFVPFAMQAVVAVMCVIYLGYWWFFQRS